MAMFEAGSWFWDWLADQPAFIEVGIGMCFVLIIAPAALAAVAILFTRVEAVIEGIVVGRFAARSPLSSGTPSTCFRFGEDEPR